MEVITVNPNARYHSKLSSSQVQEIIQLLNDERHIKQEWIARKFGVNQSTIAYHHRQLKKKKYAGDS